MKSHDRRKLRQVILGLTYSGDPGFGRGLQYSIPFQTDDAYEDWSPTQPPQFWADVRYKGGLVQNTPFFPNTRMRDPDDEWEDRYEEREDRFDGHHRVDEDWFDGIPRSTIRGMVRKLKRAS